MYTLECLVKYLHFPTFYGGAPDYNKYKMEDVRPSELEEFNKSLDELKALPEDFTGEFKGIKIEKGVPVLMETNLRINGRLTSVFFDIKAINGDLSHLDEGDYIHLLHETHYDGDGDPTQYASISMCKVDNVELAISTDLNEGVDFVEESGTADDIEDYF
jgi:hypothetical protein